MDEPKGERNVVGHVPNQAVTDNGWYTLINALWHSHHSDDVDWEFFQNVKSAALGY